MKNPTIIHKYNMDNFRPNDYNLEKDTNNKKLSYN